MKVFKTNDVNVINDCIDYLGFKLRSELLIGRIEKFNSRMLTNNNYVNSRY
jgi:hypothetical protein